MDTPEARQAKTAPEKPEEWKRFEDFSKRLLRVPIAEVRELEGDARKPKNVRAGNGA